MFFENEDFDLYLRVLRAAAERYGCAIHAYVLMTNHVHLLTTPETRRSIPLLFQAIGRSYVQAVNRKYERSGTLWEGRYRQSLVDTTEYVLTCYRYIELNPVRAGLVASPSDYAYSSYRSNALGVEDGLVVPQGNYVSLGRDADARRAAYRGLFADVMPETSLLDIRSSANACLPFGDDAFKDRLEREFGWRVRPRRPGPRPAHALNSAAA